MRIVAGRWRGRQIVVPKGEAVRPTRDRVREAWMSIVNPLLPGARVGDLCAGSGALGLEALSRGAANAEFVEQAPASLAALHKNIETLGAVASSIIRRGDALAVAAERAHDPYDVAFADPPYRTGLAERLAARWLQAPFARVLGIEHDSRDVMPGEPDTRRYGTTALSFYRLTSDRGTSDRGTSDRGTDDRTPESA